MKCVWGGRVEIQPTDSKFFNVGPWSSAIVPFSYPNFLIQFRRTAQRQLLSLCGWLEGFCLPGIGWGFQEGGGFEASLFQDRKMFWDTQNLTENKIMYILVPRLYFPLPFSTFFFIMNVGRKPQRQESIYHQQKLLFSPGHLVVADISNYGCYPVAPLLDPDVCQ